MADQSKISILAIELENFQSITSPIRIEFGTITMIYGPNSAGKSAIFDALELIKLLWDPRDRSKRAVAEIEQKLDLWAHIPKGKQNFSRSTRLAIEVRFGNHHYFEDEYAPYSTKNIGKDTYEHLEWSEDLAEHYKGKVIRFEVEARKLKDEIEWDLSIVKIIEIESNDPEIEPQSILEATKVTPSGLNLNDSHFLAIKIFNGEFSAFGFGKFCPISAEEFAKEDSPSLVMVDNKFVYAAVDIWGCLVPSTFWFIGAPAKYGYLNNTHTENTFREAYSEVTTYFGGVLVYLIDQAFPMVRADRTIPSPDETIVMCEGVSLGERKSSEYIEGQKIQHDHFIEMLSKQLPKKDYFYYQLALLARYHKIYWDSQNADYISFRSNGEKLTIDPNKAEIAKFELINRYLSDYLFTEKGYQVTCDIRFLAPIDTTFSDLNETELILSPSLVRLLLLDGDARKVEIQDVGSGIAFVLPLLVSLATQKISAIQQPELHIHPALQASIADIFVDRMNLEDNNWQALIETHSEHLLLRLLRRIRESTKNIGHENPILPKDVSVYYLNPTPEGTEARKMLITPLGDFFNTWPRGFFGERAKDLFDE